MSDQVGTGKPTQSDTVWRVGECTIYKAHSTDGPFHSDGWKSHLEPGAESEACMQVQQRVSLVCMYHPRGNLYAAEIDCVKSMHDGKEYLLVYTGWCVRSILRDDALH